MSERLLGPAEVARRLGMSRTHFYRVAAALESRGLQRVQVGGRARYRAASLDRLIRQAADRNEALIEPTQTGTFTPRTRRTHV